MLALPATLTHAQAGLCLVQLAAGIATGPKQVVLDAQPLQDFDSSALAVLLELRRACLRLGKQLHIEGAPERLMHLAALYGVRALLEGGDQASAASLEATPV
ncbi:MAG: STAS domain-containing protein [Rhodoferax sp.]|nr:STAS domain-containing protein [Rhodoferax sp.]MBJ7467263.1 STAS domain-containing protein [Rhodoferax sp.]